MVFHQSSVASLVAVTEKPLWNPSSKHKSMKNIELELYRTYNPIGIQDIEIEKFYCGLWIQHMKKCTNLKRDRHIGKFFMRSNLMLVFL